MRLVCISDTHNFFEPVPDGDVLVHCGDLTKLGTEEELIAGLQWLSKMPHEHVVFVAGNHDWLLDTNTPPVFGSYRLDRTMTPEELLGKFPRITYLQDSSATIGGWHFYGSPWQPNFFNWAFNFPIDGGVAAEHTWARIPDDVEILITHSPAFGILDLEPKSQRNLGDVQLRDRLGSLDRMRLHAFGHIHEGYGRLERGPITFVNASTCTVNYKPTNPPIIVDFTP